MQAKAQRGSNCYAATKASNKCEKDKSSNPEICVSGQELSITPVHAAREAQEPMQLKQPASVHQYKVYVMTRAVSHQDASRKLQDAGI